MKTLSIAAGVAFAVAALLSLGVTTREAVAPSDSGVIWLDVAPSGRA